MEWRDPIDLHRYLNTPGTLAEFQAQQALEDERRKADAEMAYRLANLAMPEDIRSRARAWGMEAFCEVLWNNAFQAGLREAMRGQVEEDSHDR